MIRTVPSRRVAVVAAMAIAALQWLGPSLDVRAAEGDRPVSEKRAEGRSATERQGQAMQVSADLSHDIDRLEKRGTRSAIYDLFSRPGQVSSAEDSLGQVSSAGRSKNKMSGKDGRSSGQSGRPPAGPVPVAVAAVPPPPPPIVALPPPPPAPKPPAVPFVYMGKLTETDRTVYFLVKGDKLFTVRPGDEFDGSYVFEGEVGNQISLTYKPLHVAQTLTMMGP
jgi:hypothetical protein